MEQNHSITIRKIRTRHPAEERLVEMVNWEEIFHKHIEETRTLERERQEQVEKAQKNEKRWEMLRECTAFLKENEKSWKFESNKPQLKKKKEDKTRRLT